MPAKEFNGYVLLYRLFDAYRDRDTATEEQSKAIREIARLNKEIKDAELTLCESFDRSEVKAVTFEHGYKTHAVCMVDGRLKILPAGGTYELKAPDTVIDPDLSPEEQDAAAVAAVEEIKEELGAEGFAELKAFAESLPEAEAREDAVWDALRATA